VSVLEDGASIDSPPPRPGPTQRALTPAEVAEIVRLSLGSRGRVVRASPLAGGGFATVWRADLEDGSSVVLKIGPPPGVSLLTYETGLIEAEADYLRKVRRDAPGIPVPEVLHQGDDKSVLDGTWLVMEHLPGRALAGLGEGIPADQQASVRRELGGAMARLHRIEGRSFGYPGRREAATWRETYLGVIDDLLADAARLGHELPLPAPWIVSVLAEASEALTPVVRPALIHFDLWDGNVLAAPHADGRWHLTGLVDGERSLYGDPLVDFVSADLYTPIEDDPAHPFTTGYAEAAGPAFALDPPARRRILLYRAWLYLVMSVECPTRDIVGEQRRRRDEQLRDVLLLVRGGGRTP
jgi:aminoglycoside phosphotransferase (APT) family kinase protein